MIYKISPVFKDYIWGGTRLRDELGKKTDITPVAESWELSCHRDGLSRLEGENKTLAAHIEENPKVLGSRIKDGRLPVLIKLIDAADNLSVQVHPDDKFAAEHENQNGKTEMWYVMDAREDAKIIFGLKEKCSKEKLREAIAKGEAEELLSAVPAKKGDVFFVRAGTVHAIGKGCLIAEIQQNSNVTYRLYDYNRRDKNGNLRELHIDKGVECALTEPAENHEVKILPDNSRLLGECPYFKVIEHVINGEKNFCAGDESYNSLLFTQGSGEIKFGNRKLQMNKGECAFIDAGTGEYAVAGNCTVISVHQPQI